MSFVAFVKTDEGKAVVGEEFHDRLLKSVVGDITTLTSLQNFARQRWPGDYPRDWRKPTPMNARYGRETTSGWWSEYLSWLEMR